MIQLEMSPTYKKHGPGYFHAAGLNGLHCRNVLEGLAVNKSLVRDPLCKSHLQQIPDLFYPYDNKYRHTITGLMSASVLARLVHSTWHMVVVKTHAIYSL